jgi:hypothetical protein
MKKDEIVTILTAYIKLDTTLALNGKIESAKIIGFEDAAKKILELQYSTKDEEINLRSKLIDFIQWTYKKVDLTYYDTDAVEKNVDGYLKSQSKESINAAESLPECNHNRYCDKQTTDLHCMSKTGCNFKTK